MTVLLSISLILSSITSLMSIFILYRFGRKEWLIKKDIKEIINPWKVQVYKWPTYGESLLKQEYAESGN